MPEFSEYDYMTLAIEYLRRASNALIHGPFFSEADAIEFAEKAVRLIKQAKNA